MRNHLHDYIFEHTSLATLTFPELYKHCAEPYDPTKQRLLNIQPIRIAVNEGLFGNASGIGKFPSVAVAQMGDTLLVSCPCDTPKLKLCQHQATVLHNIMDTPGLRLFFDPVYRQVKLQQFALDYGMENEPNLDQYFDIELANGTARIKPKIKELQPYTESTKAQLQSMLVPKAAGIGAKAAPAKKAGKMGILFFPHRYQHELFDVVLIEGAVGPSGKYKNPIEVVDPMQYVWQTELVQEVKFYMAISNFQNASPDLKPELRSEFMAMIVSNPLQLKVYAHDAKVSEKVIANALVPMLMQPLPLELKLTVDQKAPFFEITAALQHNDVAYPLQSLNLKYDFFIQIGNTLNFISNPNTLRVLEFFKKHNYKLVLHPSKFEAFRKDILGQLEQSVHIHYAYIQQATPAQLAAKGMSQTIEKLIYLSDEKNFVSITPVVRYGDIEIPVLSKKQIYAKDMHGKPIMVKRDEALEIRFTALLLQQRPEFEEQLGDLDYFYLLRSKLLENDWFLNAFAEWQAEDIQVLGFNKLNSVKWNMHKAKVSVHVTSDIDWFTTSLNVQFGLQKASMKQLQKAVKKRSKFVVLGDGTLGILPDEWLKEFEEYFNSGYVVDDVLRTSKNKFLEVHEIYAAEVLDQETRNELGMYLDKFTDFKGIQAVPVPTALKANLRDYQKEGLNWLNFLDDFNFGACLADDMGLGKTVQILAFLLTQRDKTKRNTNLVVVPTTLLFNWQAEIEKFAPSIAVFTHYGKSRLKQTKHFDRFEVILTSYGNLSSDVSFLKEYNFNYIILDESQAIKNPHSQRYKAVRILRARNRIVVTGTPFENNTFDIYSQMSFACPGLLGSEQHFKDIYSSPIDKFGDAKRADALQRIIQPFILRRTKKQVAKELPEKTEMVLYCPMGPLQRQCYDAAEQELRDMIYATPDKDIQKESMYVLKGLTKLRLICDTPMLLKDNTLEGEMSSKIEVLVDQISNKSHQHKILVFSQFVGMLELIRAELKTRNIRFQYLTGQSTNRAAKVNDFQTNDAVRVFLISLKAGGVGLNLTEADYVYIVDPWWNPAVENQAIDRCYRIGQQKQVVAVKLICPNTIEQKIMQLQAAKTKLSNTLIQTDGDIFKSLGKQDLLDILR